MALRYTRNTGGYLSHRVSLVTGDEPIRASLPGLPAGSAPSSICSIAAQAADAIRSGRPHVEPNFLSGAALQEARRASEAMLTKQAADKMATAPPLLRIVAAVEAIRQALADATGRRLSETGELQIVLYSPGGSYQRHIDWKPGMAIGNLGRTDVKRSLSLLIYLTDDDWNPAADGGALRVYDPKSPASHIDIHPYPGQLVIFDSSSIPHEVLTTRRARTLLAGWLHEEMTVGSGQ